MKRRFKIQLLVKKAIFLTAVAPTGVTQRRLDDFRRDPDFQYEKGIELLKTPQKEAPSYDLIGPIIAFLIENPMIILIIKLIIYSAFGFLALYLIFRYNASIQSFFINIWRTIKASQTQNVQILTEEDLLDEIAPSEIDYAEALKQAFEQKDYRRAVRLRYLQILMTLEECGQIEWHVHKTNRSYAEEIQRRELRPAFDELTYIFEYVWYGRRAPDAAAYARWVPLFETFIYRLTTA